MFAALVVVGVLLTPLLYNYFLLSSTLPGTFLARFSDLWRLLVVHRGHAHETQLNLHQSLGNIVRIGPNCVSLSGYDAIQSVYSIGQKLAKSDFYPVPQGIQNGKPYVNLFTVKSNDHHAQLKRPVARAYAMTTLLEYEPFVDTTTALFMNRLDELYASTGQICDFGKWLQYYAFDVIGEMTFSKRFGFLEKEEDVDGIIQSLHDSRWVFTIGQMPWLDRWIRKNRLLMRLTKFTSPVVTFTAARIRERIGWPGLELSPDEKGRLPPRQPRGQEDFLSRFLNARTTNPDVVDNLRVLSYAQGNVTAGSDTTAIALRAIFYYLLKNPGTMEKLQQEIKLTDKKGLFATHCVSWAESQKLVYLNAVVREGLRIHPPVGLPLERVVGPLGLSVYGTTLPAGTIVGVNPWVIHRDKDIFGPDADTFRPDRWLEVEGEQKKRMDAAMFAFGGGARTCIGKNISLLEIYKLVPTLIRRYQFELVRPGKELTLQNAFFVHQTGLDMLIQRRPE